MASFQTFIQRGRLWIATFLITLVFILPNIWSTYFNQNFVYPKWVLFDFAIALAALFLAFENRLRLPTKKMLILTCALALLRLIPVLFNFNWVTASSYVYAIAMAITAIYFASVWRDQKLKMQSFFWPYLISTYAISALVLYQFVNSRLINGNPDPLFYSGPFGNINMMCEYLIFMLPFGILLMRQLSGGWRSWLMQIGVTAWITILMIGQSRSAWIGLAICFIYCLWRGLSKREWVSYGIGLVIFLCVQQVPYQGSDYGLAKSGSFAKRLTLYHGASRMLLDQPLGIGGGEFEYGYIPYQMTTLEAPVEKEKFNTPHNEFLKWGIENGWAFLIAICFWWLILGIQVWKIQAPRELQTFYRTSYLVLGPQMFFQFPFENPASCLATLFLIGLMLSSGPGIDWPLKKWARALLMAFAALLFVKASTQTYSRWVESQYFEDRDAMKSACHVDRSNWRVCFLYSMSLLDFYPEDAHREIITQLEQRPFDFHALRALGFYYINSKKLKESCEIAHVYDSFFLGASLFTPFVRDNCRQIDNPVPFKSSEDFNRDYRQWLERYL